MLHSKLDGIRDIKVIKGNHPNQLNVYEFKDTVAIPEFSGKKPINFEITISRRCYHVVYFSFQIL